MLFPGIVDQHVEPAPRPHHLRHGGIAEITVADIACDRQRLTPLGADDRGGLFGIVMLAQIDDRDMRALAREQRRDRTADAAIRPRDDRDLALQPARPPIARFPRSEEHTSELQSLMRISYAVFCLQKKTHTS